MSPIMKELLSGNEAMALGAYHAGVKVAAAYPGTPSTEILENLAKHPDIHAEWSTNEKVAMEVALGACYTGVRAMASMKHVGLNVASDPFMAAAITGVVGGLVVVAASDPGMHSSQNEQDNRYFARLGKVALLEPGDSQEAYELMRQAFDISEHFDLPVLFCPTTRVAHAKSVVVTDSRRDEATKPASFQPDKPKLVMLPAYARQRHPLALARLDRLAEFAETFSHNRVIKGSRGLGIVTSGVAFQYAREVFPEASFLKLAMVFPLPENLIRDFAGNVDNLIVIEELDPFLEEQIKAMGIKVQGKKYIPRAGELNPDIVRQAALQAGWIKTPAGVNNLVPAANEPLKLPPRPPLLCPGCPHTGIFFTLSSLGLRKPKEDGRPGLVITGDIGCYTLGAYPPLSAMDTCACMGAGLGQAQGMEWAGLSQKVVAVIGDSTFIHSGVSGLINAVYNRSRGTILILDNSTTAMTGHQPHPGAGTTAQGEPTQSVDLESLVRGIGVTEVNVVSAFDLKALRLAVKSAIDSPRLSVVIVRGPCAVQSRRQCAACRIDITKCDKCGICLMLGCPAIQKSAGHAIIDASLCIGEGCGLCAQLCPHRAINLHASEALHG
jgi:indolepyruvate ferredoxin oxidoreductase, alpha subunit